MVAPNYRSLVPGGFFSSTPFDRTMKVSIRCNNPGAINGASWEKHYPGYVDTVETTPGNKTTIFEAPEYGVAVWWELLRRYAANGDKTVGGIINRYGGGQDYSNYVRFVARQTGYADDHAIPLDDDDVLLAFGKAMFHYEAGGPTPLSDAQIRYGLNLGRHDGIIPVAESEPHSPGTMRTVALQTHALFPMGGDFKVLSDATAKAGPTATVPAVGWVLKVQRLREEKREGEFRARTVGTYSVFRNGNESPAFRGYTVERQGPGDNGPTGKANHRRVAAGTYPLRAHSTAKYRTTGYRTDGQHPRPAIEVSDTGDRSGILIHPADGYGSTIGCFNLAGPLANADSDIVLPESIARVVALISDIKDFGGGQFAFDQDGNLAHCQLIVIDPTEDSHRITNVDVPVTDAFPAGMETVAYAEAAASADTTVAALRDAAADDCLIYEQATGRMSVRNGGSYDLLGTGYSGSKSGGGYNDPSKQCVKMVGPIPRGQYKVGPPGPGPSPYSLRLTPAPGTDTCGRSGFLIHGDSISHPGNASEGCIILSRSEREAIVKTGLTTLVVVDQISA
ncbi:Protein of unknown function [Bradyrhizobium brasilense]|uniref:Tlde1 domain-containing protein n=1 Tax=Bradyrhizobium brasilense TaxID=1419277 RepID=A0A1G7F7Z8_9BRAD|nr:DUF5675 family protein [Bradyrhizobium brasilense]SDE71964.1 Protein of unknown function [Bradyrhizobium brasilense]